MQSARYCQRFQLISSPLILSEMVKAESEVRSSFSPRLSLEMSLIRVSFISALKPVKEAIENIEALMKGLPQNSSQQSALRCQNL